MLERYRTFMKIQMPPYHPLYVWEAMEVVLRGSCMHNLSIVKKILKETNYMEAEIHRLTEIYKRWESPLNKIILE